MNDELIGALRQANHDYTNGAADLIEAQASRMERLDARIVELKAEAKLWWDENLKKQTACEQMGKRIAELEAALDAARRDAMEEAAKKALIIASVLSDPSAQNALRSFAEAIRAELEGGKDD